MNQLTLDPGQLTLPMLREVYLEPVRVELDERCVAGIVASQETVQRVLDEGRTVYGINTGFGLLANKRIPPEDLQQLQKNVVLSHAAGTGPLLEDRVVRLAMVLKINSLGRGYSGVRLALIEALLSLLNAEAIPCIPSQGSVGASGDLAPLAHLASVLIGVGEIQLGEETLAAADALNQLGIEKLTLAPKEGVALLNGTQISTALALAGLFEAENVFSAAMVAGAMSIDAARATDTPFDPRIQAVRGHQGQIDCAECYVELLAGSEIRASHLDCSRVQDPYSLRCQPQVMGACLDHMRFVAGVLEREANAVSDNPLVFSESGDILSGGNFHGEPVAMSSDTLALAIAEIGSLSERRIALLIDKHQSDLPSFLVEDSGLNSGFMIPHVTAVSLVSENKSLAHPACVDNLPTSANQEDHVSMATFAARRLGAMNTNAATIVAIELLAACQGIDLRRPLTTSERLQQVHVLVRDRVPFYDQDRPHAPDITTVTALVQSGELREFSSANPY
jgi:histidine ammonia-lyase